MKNQPPFDRRAIPATARLFHRPAPDGWPLRMFDWPAPGSGAATARGSLLFLGGRGDIIEKYLESFAHWRAAGWHIRAVDWRGQGGSGRLAADPLCGHADDFAPWIADLADFGGDWRATTPGPHVVIGHSMGGHLLLRGLAEGAIAPDAAILVAPMLGLHSGPLGPRVGGAIAALLARIGRPDRMAWKTNERPSLPGASRRRLLTHDAERYADELWWKETSPELALGPPSWAWVAAAYRSIAALDRPGALEGIATPVLLLGAERDGLVKAAAIRRAARRLPAAELLMFGPESAHEILRESDGVRDRALARIDAFLDARAPAPARNPDAGDAPAA
jgi:lysophospholipase